MTLDSWEKKVVPLIPSQRESCKMNKGMCSLDATSQLISKITEQRSSQVELLMSNIASSGLSKLNYSLLVCRRIKEVTLSAMVTPPLWPRWTYRLKVLMIAKNVKIRWIHVDRVSRCPYIIWIQIHYLVKINSKKIVRKVKKRLKLLKGLPLQFSVLLSLFSLSY